jgi:hypothetical protein
MAIAIPIPMPMPIAAFPAALSGSRVKATGFAGGYLLSSATVRFDHIWNPRTGLNARFLGMSQQV